MDAQAGFTVRDQVVPILAMTDHCSARFVGLHVVRRGPCVETLEPTHRAIREQFIDLIEGIAPGAKLGHDYGALFMSDDLQREIRFLGLECSPALVRAPQGKACMERFFRSLGQRPLQVWDFGSVEELAEASEELCLRCTEQHPVERRHF